MDKRYPTNHNNLGDFEEQNKNVIQEQLRKDKILLDVNHKTDRNTGTLDGRQIGGYLGHYFTSNAGSVP